MITLTNNYHNTSVHLRASVGDYLTQSQISRARRELCGMSDCDCCSSLGTRGHQSVSIESGYIRGNDQQIYLITGIEDQ